MTIRPNTSFMLILTERERNAFYLVDKVLKEFQDSMPPKVISQVTGEVITEPDVARARGVLGFFNDVDVQVFTDSLDED